MSSLLPTLLALLVLLAGPRAARTLHSQTLLLLKENIGIVEQVSCDKMNVTDIFADSKTENTTELLCKAFTIVRESQHCHSNLQGLFLNMHQLMRVNGVTCKASCPMAAGNTTSMAKFLGDLRVFFQQLVKQNLLSSP